MRAGDAAPMDRIPVRTGVAATRPASEWFSRPPKNRHFRGLPKLSSRSVQVGIQKTGNLALTPGVATAVSLYQMDCWAREA